MSPSPKAGKGIKRLQTGITGLDEVFGGGVPEGRALLLAGGAGTGKTVFLNSFLYHGITVFGQNGVFVTFEERPADICENVRSFGWDYGRLVRAGKLAFVDVGPDAESLGDVESGAYDLTPLIARVKDAVRRTGARRVAMDSVGNFFGRFSDRAAVRAGMFRLYDALKGAGVTTFVSAEAAGGSHFGVEDYVVDAMVDLTLKAAQQKVGRELVIRKMRGAGYRSGRVEYDISDRGVEVYPKIPVDRGMTAVDFKRRRAFGVPGLDEALSGGLPQGHMCLLSGNTGTGKTLLALHFLAEGLRRGESCVYVAMEEHVEEVRRRARTHGMVFDKYEKGGKLAFITPESLIDIGNDKLLYEIVNAVRRGKVSRLVFDSISSLMSATMSEEDVRQFLVQLSGFCKSLGVTCVLNYLMGESFGAVGGQLLGSTETNVMRLSSVVDAIVVMRYVERDQSIKKVLNVLKVRGSGHSKDLFQYDIDSGGFQMGERFVS